MQCAPHKPATAWSTVNNQYDHHYNNYHYHDRRAYSTKLLEVEKKMEKLEKSLENSTQSTSTTHLSTLPTSPEAPEVDLKEKEIPVKTQTTTTTTTAEPEKSCTSCSAFKLEVEKSDSATTETQNIEISDPYKYYSCLAVEVECSPDSKFLKLSDDAEIDLKDHTEKIVLTCEQGNWVYVVSENEAPLNVQTLSCV